MLIVLHVSSVARRIICSIAIGNLLAIVSWKPASADVGNGEKAKAEKALAFSIFGQIPVKPRLPDTAKFKSFKYARMRLSTNHANQKREQHVSFCATVR
jgi:hypothetical protein